MFSNILKAEFYKRYSRLSTWIIPVAISVFIFIAYLIVSADNGDYYTRSAFEEFLTIISPFAMLTIFIGIYFVYGLIPVVLPIQTFVSDLKNSRIATTVASGVRRGPIFNAKLLVIITEVALYFILMTLTLILIAFMEDITIAEIWDDMFGNGYISEAFVIINMMLLLTYSLVTNILSAVLSSIITKSNVPAFFLTYVLNNVAGLVLMILFFTIGRILEISNVSSYDVNINKIYVIFTLMITISYLIITTGLYFISYRMFAKRDF